MKQQTKTRLLLTTLIALQVGVLLAFTVQKKGYFIDEIYSWGLSNSYYQPFVMTDGLFGRWVEGSELGSYMTVQPGERFAYGSVYYNQTQDVHPPFFYMLLHTICSFTPRVWGTWQGMIINTAAYIGCLLMIFLTARHLLDSEYLAMAAMVLWGLSPGGISTGIYIRMYMLASFFTVTSVYLHVRMALDGQTPRRLSLICLVTFIGLLTQYYVVFAAFFLSAVYVLWKMSRRKWKEAAVYSAALLASVGAMTAVFPACITQLTRTDEFVAEETRSNLAGGRVLVTNLISYISSINRDFLGGRIREAALIVLLLAVFCLWRRRRRSGGKERFLTPKDRVPLALTLVLILCFLSVSWVAVVPGVRYIYNLYPLMVILALWWTVHFARWAMGNKKDSLRLCAGVGIAVLALYLWGYGHGCVQYLYPENEERTRLAASLNDLDCLYIDNYENAPLTQDLIELAGFPRVYMMPASQIGELNGILSQETMRRGLVVYVDTNEFWSSGYDAEAVMEQLLEETDFETCSFLYSNELSETYLLR